MEGGPIALVLALLAAFWSWRAPSAAPPVAVPPAACHCRCEVPAAPAVQVGWALGSWQPLILAALAGIIFSGGCCCGVAASCLFRNGRDVFPIIGAPTVQLGEKPARRLALYH